MIFSLQTLGFATFHNWKNLNLNFSLHFFVKCSYFLILIGALIWIVLVLFCLLYISMERLSGSLPFVPDFSLFQLPCTIINSRKWQILITKCMDYKFKWYIFRQHLFELFHLIVKLKLLQFNIILMT